MAQSGYLVDTNVLLRLTNPRTAQYPICQYAITQLAAHGCLLYCPLQNTAELWNVFTRAVDRDGQSLSTSDALKALVRVERTMTLLPDTAQVYDARRELITTHDVRGVQVHDAKLAAAMLVHDISHILTSTPPTSPVILESKPCTPAS